MRGLEQLLGRLSVGLDHGEQSLSLDSVAEVADVDAVVGGRMEDVDGIDGCFPALFEAEDEVDPRRQAPSHNLRLQRLPMDEGEEARVA